MGRDMMRLRRGILLNTPHEEQASGAVASFATDISKLKECVVGIEPVQDLHGYDSPWPPGGGKNLLDMTIYTGGSYNGTIGNVWNLTPASVQLTQNGSVFTIELGSWSTRTFFFPLTDGEIVHFKAVFSATDMATTYGYLDSEFHLLTKYNQTGATITRDINFTGSETYAYGYVLFVPRSSKQTITITKPQLEKGSTATSWTPYENICPISGWSEANVYDDPKYDKTVWWNQAFLPASDWKAHSVQTRFSVSDGVITATLVSGSPSVYAPAISIEGGIVVTSIANHKYYFACKFNPAADGYPYLRNNTAFSTAAVFGTKTTRAGEWGSYENIVSAPATGGPAWYLGNVGNTSQIQIGDSFSIKDLMCIDLTAIFGAGNEPSTVDEFKALFPNDYYAYNAGEETLVSAVNGDPYRVVTIDLDGTRYGGMLNVLTGVLRVTHEVDIFDSSYNFSTWGVNYRKSGITGFYWYSTPPDLSTFKQCDVLPVTNSIWGGNAVGTWNNTTNPNSTYYMFCFPNTTLGIVDEDSSQTAISKLLTYLNDNPISVCKTLADPFDVQLTPAQLRAIKGQNNIFADCGDVAVKYWKH